MQENIPDSKKSPQQGEKAGKVPMSWKKEEHFNVPVTGVPSSEMNAKLAGVRKILDLGSAVGSEEKKDADPSKGQAPAAMLQTDRKPYSWIRRLFS